MSPPSHWRPHQASQSRWPDGLLFLENQCATGILGKGAYLCLEVMPAALEGYKMCPPRDRRVLLPESRTEMPLWARQVLEMYAPLSSVWAVSGMQAAGDMVQSSDIRS